LRLSTNESSKNLNPSLEKGERELRFNVNDLVVMDAGQW
jgi:hypothetical protein